jgi:O-acetylhomoserine/O-acetylserine sulfhydrylase-like pyridoxal-dependent enzyme
MPGLLRGIARTAVVAGTASAVGGRVRHRQDQKWARQDAQAAQPEPQYAEPQYAEPEQSSAPPAKDRLQQLKELGDLKAQGVLTEEEFATEKAKILAG